MVLVAEGLGTDDPRRGNIVGHPRHRGGGGDVRHVSIYILQLEPSPVDVTQQRIVMSEAEDRHAHRGGLDTLAGMSRGTVFRVAAGAEYAFERIGRELSGYYLLGFEPEEGDRDGKGHGLKVQVARRNVSVRLRDRVVIPLPDSGRARRGGAQRLAAQPLPRHRPRGAGRDLRHARQRRRKVRVLTAAEVGEARGGVTVGFVLEDKKGKVVGERRAARCATAPQELVTIASTVVVDPGVYTLRLAARDRRAGGGASCTR